jgi:O-antigen/teichoic acid export membrane protein
VRTESSVPEHSLGLRYSFKVFASLANLALGFIVAGLVPKSLGVQAYGDYSYLTTFFGRMAGFLDFRTSTCFYIKLSQDRDNRSIVTFYAYYVALVIIVMFLLTGLLAFLPIRDILMPGRPTRYILMAALVGLLAWMLDTFTSSMDAYGHTLSLEKMRFVNKVLSVLLVLGMNHFGYLNYQNFFLYQYVISIPLIVVVTVFLVSKGHWRKIPLQIPSQEIRKLSKDFFAYSAPLFSYTAIAFGVVIYDRWLLEIFGGNSAQGLYAFGFGFMTYGYLFTNAIQPLMVREMSVAVKENDPDRIADLYHKFYPLLFSVTAYFSAFLFIEADRIITIFGGSQYALSSASFRILLLYPLINVFSGLNSAVILTNNRTKLFLHLSLIFAPVGCILLYALIATRGMNLGATGLAIKVIAMESISLITITIIVSRNIAIRPAKVLLHFLFLGSYLLLASICDIVVDRLNMGVPPLITFLICGFVYTLALTASLLLAPNALGISKSQLLEGMNRINPVLARFRKP